MDPSGAKIVHSEFIYENAPFPSCHASTIEETKAGLITAFFGGTDEKNPDVGIWVSRHENGKWTAPVEVANGVQSDGKRPPTWNPVLFQPGSGPLLLFYKVGPSPSRWWGMMMRSTDDQDVKKMAAMLLTMAGLFQIFDGLQVSGSGARLLMHFAEDRDGFGQLLRGLSADGSRHSSPMIIRPRERAPMRVEATVIPRSPGDRTSWLWFFMPGEHPHVSPRRHEKPHVETAETAPPLAS